MAVGSKELAPVELGTFEDEPSTTRDISSAWSITTIGTIRQPSHGIDCELMALL